MTDPLEDPKVLRAEDELFQACGGKEPQKEDLETILRALGFEVVGFKNVKEFLDWWEEMWGE